MDHSISFMLPAGVNEIGFSIPFSDELGNDDYSYKLSFMKSSLWNTYDVCLRGQEDDDIDILTDTIKRGKVIQTIALHSKNKYCTVDVEVSFDSMNENAPVRIDICWS